MSGPIDMHVHMPTESFFGTLEPFLEKLRRYFRSDAGVRDVKSVLKEYEEVGIEKLVMLPVNAVKISGRVGDTNELMAEIQRISPERLIGFATVDPMSPKQAVEELYHAINNLGLRGLKLHPQLQCFRPDDERAFRVMKQQKSLGYQS